MNTNTAHISLLDQIGAAFRAAGDRVLIFMEGVAEITSGAACVREAARLSQLSDEELSELGLDRDEIVPHVFGELSRKDL